MAVSLEEFKAYIGTKDDSEFPQECLTAGHALVTRFVGDVTGVPVSVHDQAVLIVSSELFHRRNSPQGYAQFADGSGIAARVGRDAMSAAYPLLMPYTGYAV